MRVFKSLTMAFCLGAFILSIPLAAKADEWNKATRLTFNKPVEIPGMVLGPGTYVFKLADLVDRNVVQIYNADETHLYKDVLAIPSYRSEPTDKTVITFEERAQGSPQAVKEWFYPGNSYGEEFVYPAVQTVHVAQKSVLPAVAQHLTPVVPAPQQQAAAPPAPNNEPVQIAQVTPTPQPAASSPAAAQKAPEKLPRTASSLPLLALIGLLSLGGSAGVRVFSKRSI